MEKEKLKDKKISYNITGLNRNVAFNIDTSGGRWKWYQDKDTKSPLNCDNCPVTVIEISKNIFMIGRPDYNLKDTLTLVFNFNTMKVIVSGRDEGGKGMFITGDITQYQSTTRSL